MDFSKALSTQFNLSLAHSQNIINLIDEGNTIPFIARYRKEMTGSCDDQVLREFADKLAYLRKFVERKEAIIASITEQEKMTPEITAALEKCETLTELEDVYRPYKPKRKTRATVAVAKGLSPLAEMILAQDKSRDEIIAAAEKYISEEKGVKSAAEAVTGAQDIICEIMSDNADLRKALREYLFNNGTISTRLNHDNPEAKDKLSVFEMYDNRTEAIKNVPPHRVLAINRGEKEGCLTATLEIPEEAALNIINSKFVTSTATSSELVREAAADSYTRLIKPSIEREIRSNMFETASEQAIKMFELNLRPLLLQPPVKNKVTMGVDPAYRTGCKIAVVDGSGAVLDRAVVYPTPPQNKKQEASAALTNMIKKHKVQTIAIGNGTASKESEIFIAELIKTLPEYNLSYMVVNEAGASVYSASKLAAEEFPDFDVAHRSAASIARRLQDPLAELIKIDPKSIGVGQYQHDMPPARLDSVLGGVVEDCVNSVGVDLNTASYSLLTFVSGLNSGVAKSIVKYRTDNGQFTSREQLKKVPKLGDKAYEQSAGFLRIPYSKNILDNTAVHPESYPAALKLLELFKLSMDNAAEVAKLPELVNAYGIAKAAEAIGVGVPTLNDIMSEIIKPGRDIRDTLPPPMLRTDVMEMKDLKEGMELKGTVRNVIDFGVFVDIGVHQDGLVHISEITDTYIKHPSEALSVGEVVTVRVKGVDVAKNRISLTMKSPDGAPAPKRENNSTPNRNNNRREKGGYRGGDYMDKDTRSTASAPSKNLTLEESLQLLAKKFNSK